MDVRGRAGLVLAVVLLAAGCGSPDTTDEPTSATASSTPDAGTGAVDGSQATSSPPDDGGSAPEDEGPPPHAEGPPGGGGGPDTYVGEEGLQVSSGPVTDDDTIPRPFTCDGHDRHPPFLFGEVPEGTQELAIVMHDRDADVLHWQLTGIPPDVGRFEAGQLPPGAVEGENGFGETGYAAPCQPDGERHAYVFTVYALSAPVEPQPASSVADVRGAYAANAVSEVELVGHYR